MPELEQMAAAVSAARVVLEQVGSLSTAPNGEVEELLSGTAALSRIVDALQVRLAGEVAERSTGPVDESLCRRMGNRSEKEAVAQSFGIHARDAQQLLSLAAMTAPGISFTGGEIAVKYPRVRKALDAGAISLAQARVIVAKLEPAAPRADLEQLAWAEASLVDAATDPDFPLVPELLVTQARVYVAAIDPDGVLPEAERKRTERSFRIWREAGGWAYRGWSPAEDGSVVKSVLDAHTGPRVKVAFRTDGHDGCSGDCGDGCEAGRHADANGQPSVDGVNIVDDRTREQKQHDVIVGLARAHAASGDAPVVGGEAPTLVFTGTIDAFNAYLHDRPSPERTLTIEHTGDLVPIESVGRLACDAIILHAVVNGAGQVLNLGRTARLFNRAQRRALAARDKGCRVPGCGMPVASCEAHHILPWDDGGPTDIDLGIFVCAYHHHEIHAGRLRIEVAGPEPGNWRIVPALRTSDRYARATRTGRAPAAARPTAVAPAMVAGRETGSLAAAAKPALAVKLPETAPASRPPRRPARVRRRGVESRLRALLDREPRRVAPAAAFDLRPPAHIVMRT